MLNSFKVSRAAYLLVTLETSISLANLTLLLLWTYIFSVCSIFRTNLLTLKRDSKFFVLDNNNIFSEAVLHRCSYGKVFWKHAANLLGNIHPKVQFQQSCKRTSLGHGYSPVNVLNIFRTHLPENIFEEPLPYFSSIGTFQF